MERVTVSALCALVVATPAFAFRPDDPHFPLQENLEEIGMPAAWDVTLGDPDIVVAIVSTGIEYTHEDAPVGYRPDLSFNAVDPGADPIDDNGVGTHLAGIVAAATNNGAGVAGIAPDVSIAGVKVIGELGSGTSEQVEAGIEHAIDIHAHVILLGFSSSSTIDPDLEDAIHRAAAGGALLVAGARGSLSFPGRLPDVVAVGGCSDPSQCIFDAGPEIDLTARGMDVLSLYLGNTYAFYTDTDQAAAHVAGVAALLWSKCPNMTADEVRGVLEATAEDISLPGRDDRTGFGLVRADLALATECPVVVGSVTVERQGEGDGSVTSDPAGIDCGATCSAGFPVGSEVRLDATADATSVFLGWDGACAGEPSESCTVGIDGALVVSATFAPDVAAVVAVVNELSAAGALRSSDAFRLGGMLRAAQHQRDLGNDDIAAALLRVFLAQVRSLYDLGRIDAPTATRLADAAQSVLDWLDPVSTDRPTGRRW